MLLLVVASSAGAAEQGGWKAGVAAVKITPDEPMPMAGYASRGAIHAEGTLIDLWAKALLLEGQDGNRALLITLDLVGIDGVFSRDICTEITKRYGLRRDQIVLALSHTHTGPVVARNLRPMHYMLLDEDNQHLVNDYATFLQQKIVDVAGKAIESSATAEVSWGSGTADFAVNRRANKEAEVPQLREQNKLTGPVDHDVPVLAVRRDGKLVAVVFGYACHCTTLSLNQWSGDYAGYAQLELETMHPDAIAMFWAGCGADQNPLPRRTVELAKSYGHQLASAVEKVLSQPMKPVTGKLSTQYREIDLPFDTLPTREDLVLESTSSNKYIAVRAKSLLAKLDAGETISPTYPYPVAMWKLGETVKWISLGGEVVVDYAIRLKSELGTESSEDEATHGDNIWVTGYSHDVMAYIPSRRVLGEGGYEGGGAMIYYGLPTIWGADVEEKIVEEVHRQSKATDHR